MKNIAVIILISLISFSASAQTMSEQRILDRLRLIEKQLIILEKEFYKNGKQRISRNNTGGGTAEIEVRVSELEEQVKNLTGKLEEAEFFNDNLRKKLSSLTANITKAPSQVNTGQVRHSPPKITQSSQTDNNMPASLLQNNKHILGSLPKNQRTKSDPIRAAYDKAFQHLSSKKYAKAATAFTNFIEKHPSNKLTGNAYYWLGETFYAQKDYKNASIRFLKGYHAFQNGQKAPDNLLKLAMSLIQMNKNKEACTTLDKLRSEFPRASSPIIKRMKIESNKLQC